VRFDHRFAGDPEHERAGPAEDLVKVDPFVQLEGAVRNPAGTTPAGSPGSLPPEPLPFRLQLRQFDRPPELVAGIGPFQRIQWQTTPLGERMPKASAISESFKTPLHQVADEFVDACCRTVILLAPAFPSRAAIVPLG
jgi:hypothetical protein